MLVLGSAQLLVLGILGEYVGRLYIESKGRPLFVIQEVLAGPRPPEGGAS
jgi:dolichol-phosphate mannosyltransferase